MRISVTTIGYSPDIPSGAMAMESVTKAINNVVIREAKTVRNQMARPTRTWQEHHPNFEVEINVSGGNFGVTVSTDSDVYFWLDQGTSVRYATMTEDFKAKTRVRNLNSRGGTGGLAYVSRRVPRDGIEARQWTDYIMETRFPKFSASLQKAINRAVLRGLGYI